MANQYLGLSLFVMLLSFFIILNSMSKFEDSKAKSVLSSLDVAFAGGILDREEQAPSLEQAEKLDTNEGDTLDRIEGLFENNISNYKVAKNRFGTEMRIILPLEEFEEQMVMTEQVLRNDAALQGETTFLTTLVSLIQSEETSAPYRMDIILKTGRPPAEMRNEVPEELAVYTNKATSFSRQLEQEGMPVKFISIGLDGGEKDYVELLFRRYEPMTLGLLDKVRENEQEEQR